MKRLIKIETGVSGDGIEFMKATPVQESDENAKEESYLESRAERPQVFIMHDKA